MIKTLNQPVRLAVGMLTLMVCATAQAHEPPAVETINSVKAQGRFTPNDGTYPFPPEPRDISNVRVFPVQQIDTAAGMLNDASSDRRQGLAESVARRPEAQDALGNRYCVTTVSNVTGKWQGKQNFWDVTYFSHSHNQTVVAQMRNGNLAGLQITPAIEGQPALGECEKEEAISLARDYWLAKGEADVSNLYAYAIQTFPPAGGHFPVRMSYVSFHDAPALPPVFTTMVDLTNQQIIEAELDQ